MDKDCTTCRNLHDKANVIIVDRNKEDTFLVFYCGKKLEAFERLMRTKDDSNFDCPAYEQR